MMCGMTTLERAEAAEHAMSEELDRLIVKSVLYTSGELDPTFNTVGYRIINGTAPAGGGAYGLALDLNGIVRIWSVEVHFDIERQIYFAIDFGLGVLVQPAGLPFLH